jgi:NAD+ synthase (glutamine-hydrolysing)
MERARETKSAIVYVNQVGAQDELVFDGSSVVVSANGDIVTRLKSFEADFAIVDIASDGSVALGDIVAFESD